MYNKGTRLNLLGLGSSALSIALSFYCLYVTMGADLCSTLEGRRTEAASAPVLGVGAGGGCPLPQWGFENLENFICQKVHIGRYLCDNCSTEWVHFAPFNINVEAFLINFLLLDS